MACPHAHASFPWPVAHGPAASPQSAAPHTCPHCIYTLTVRAPPCGDGYAMAVPLRVLWHSHEAPPHGLPDPASCRHDRHPLVTHPTPSVPPTPPTSGAHAGARARAAAHPRRADRVHRRVTPSLRKWCKPQPLAGRRQDGRPLLGPLPRVASPQTSIGLGLSLAVPVGLAVCESSSSMTVPRRARLRSKTPRGPEP